MFIKQAVRKFAVVAGEELIAGVADLITATLTKKSTFKAKGVIAHGLKRFWSYSGDNSKLWVSGKEGDNELGNGYPPPPEAEVPIPMCWWNDKWQNIEILHDRFLERKEVSRNLEF